MTKSTLRKCRWCVVAGSVGALNGSVSRRAYTDTLSIGQSVQPSSSTVDYEDCVRKPTRLESLPVNSRATRKKTGRTQNGY